MSKALRVSIRLCHTAPNCTCGVGLGHIKGLPHVSESEPSQACGGVIFPADAAAVQQQSQPVVLHVPEAWVIRLIFLDSPRSQSRTAEGRDPEYGLLSDGGLH